jgi:hypothetical protein
MRRIVTERHGVTGLQKKAVLEKAAAFFGGNPHYRVANTLPGQYHSALFRSPKCKEDFHGQHSLRQETRPPGSKPPRP